MTTSFIHGQKQQRARQQLSCTACRAGKLKCNRQHPCDQCHKRSKEDTCHYLPPPPKKKQNRNTKERIAHLEGLVVQLMSRDGSNNSTSVTPPISEDGNSSRSRERENSGQSHGVSTNESPLSDDSSDSTSQGLSYLRISNGGQSSYRGFSHWEAILDSIAELRENIDDEDEDEEQLENLPRDEQNVHFTKNVIIGVPPPVTRDVLISSLPPKHIADRLLWHWFNSTDPGLPMIHQPTFLTQYNTLWSNPSRVPTMWLALLFCILSLGSKIALFTITNERRDTMHKDIDPDRFQQLGASALALADYTKPQRYLVEALMTLVSCEYMNFNRGHTIWLMMAFIIRIALRMGYHRDAENFPNVSVFDGEMRRRVWNIVYTFDVLHSYQEGMPSMIQQVHSDTKPPANLLDLDFGPDTEVLPEPRPLMELSPVSYRVVKNLLSRVFARACDLSNMTQAPDYDEVIKLEKELEEIYEQTPTSVRFSSMSQAILDPPNLIFSRFKLELLFHKTRCVLHRRYMFQDHVGTPREPSRRLCVDAAICILQHHESIFVAAQDGGQLSSSRFYIASLNSADFLLAAMVLCLELHLISVAPSPAQEGPNQDRVEEMRSLLERSYNIWKQPVNHFTDTDKAAKAMEAILRKVPSSANTSVTSTSMTSGDANKGRISNFSNDAHIAPIPGSFGSIPVNDTNFFEPIPGMLQEGTDWATWDKMILQYNDPNNDASGWPADLDSLDFSGMPDFGPTTFDADSGATMMANDWGSVNLENPIHGVPGSGVMPFQFSPNEGN